MNDRKSVRTKHQQYYKHLRFQPIRRRHLARRIVLCCTIYITVFTFHNFVFVRYSNSRPSSSSSSSSAVIVVDATWSPHHHPLVPTNSDSGILSQQQQQQPSSPSSWKHLLAQQQTPTNDDVSTTLEKDCSRRRKRDETEEADQSKTEFRQQQIENRSSLSSRLSGWLLRSSAESWCSLLFGGDGLLFRPSTDPVRSTLNAYRRKQQQHQQEQQQQQQQQEQRKLSWTTIEHQTETPHHHQQHPQKAHGSFLGRFLMRFRGGSSAAIPSPENSTDKQQQQQQQQYYSNDQDQQVYDQHYQHQSYHQQPDRQDPYDRSHPTDTQQDDHRYHQQEHQTQKLQVEFDQNRNQEGEHLQPHNEQQYQPNYQNQLQAQQNQSVETYQQEDQIQPSPPIPPQEDEPFVPPIVRVKHISMALRLTSEWNRRLLNGIQNRRRQFFTSSPARSSSRASQLTEEMGNVSPSQSYSVRSTPEEPGQQAPNPNKYYHDDQASAYQEAPASSQHGPQHQPTQLEHRHDQPYNTDGGDRYYEEQQHRPVNVHPSRVWHPPIPQHRPSQIHQPIDQQGLIDNVGDIEEESLTVFHAMKPATSSSSGSVSSIGVKRWGPDMEVYLDGLIELFGLKVSAEEETSNSSSSPSSGSNIDDDIGTDQRMIELPLAMIYLDRACSVDTPRTLFQGYRQHLEQQQYQQQQQHGMTAVIGPGGGSGGGGRIGVVAPCPFCTPRTVHRLALAALLLAVESVHGTARMEQSCLRIIQELRSSQSSSSSSDHSVSSLLPSDLSAKQLLHMVQWMKAALGDAGLLVTVEEMKVWISSWETVFGRLDQ